jgi:hypothetical protein
MTIKYREIEKKNRVGADQTFQLAIRDISIKRCQSVLKVRLVILRVLKS